MHSNHPKELLCTLGPASLNERVISRLADLGVGLFRLNLSHTKIEDLTEAIHLIQRVTSVPICLDSEGAQIRTGCFSVESITLKEGGIARILNEPVPGSCEELFLNPLPIVEQLRVGDLIDVDFDSALVQVIDTAPDHAVIRVLSGGVIGRNKAVDVDREIDLTALTDKDRRAIEIGKSMGIRHIALSFANKADDVALLREIAGQGTTIISKIESSRGLVNLAAITEISDAILIDRGDLSRQLPIEEIPAIQKLIVQHVRRAGKKVYVATNLLESMTSLPTPTRAEVNDVFNTLADGADGLVLAAETAIGRHPLKCASMIKRIIRRFADYENGEINHLGTSVAVPSPMLVEPHGGTLVDRTSEKLELDHDDRLSKVRVGLRTRLDVEQIASGAYSPLTGFMNRDEVRAVVETHRLPDGTIWPLPITLQLPESVAREFATGQRIALVLEGSDDVFAVMTVGQAYELDLDQTAEAMFGTTSRRHPGVELLKNGGPFFVGGEIDIAARPRVRHHYELTPRQTRYIFEKKGWDRVVGFHSRNVAHRVHEHIQKVAHDMACCDGIFIHPVVGPKKRGDFADDIILRTYQLLVDRYYPADTALLGAFHNYPRYAGPREAVFTALCRKNFGCSHFIVGRDHTDVGDFYELDDSRRLFEQLGDVGIAPVFFDEYRFCRTCDTYVSKSDCDCEATQGVSGTRLRQTFADGEMPPDWLMREEVSRFIRESMDSGAEVFVR
jgi:pyruvate kinase